MWDFETEPGFQAQLDWADEFLRAEVEPLDHVLGDPYDKTDPQAARLVAPLRAQVRERGLWACHLPPDLGGQGYGQLRLALLLDGEISSCYSMTEPHAGADPTLFRTSAVRRGDSWIIDGEKWFSSNARHASFLLVMAVTDPDADPHHGMSMFIVPAGTPGVEIVRDSGVGPESAGRIHHGMRTIAQMRKAFDLMCERAVSRTTRHGRLADLESTQDKIAQSWIEIEQFRLLLLRTAWLIDEHRDYAVVRKDIAAVKVAMPAVYAAVVQRAMQLHGALGVSNEMPFAAMLIEAQVMGIADGPTEVHRATVARQILRDVAPGEPLFGSGHLPALAEAARRHVAARLEHEVAAL